MTIDSRSTLADVAGAVGGALKSAGIDAVLTGGACATIYSGGEYQSFDLDFILVGGATRKGLDAAMGSAGFHRVVDRYVHARTKFFVEFPRGPLSIGADSDVRPSRLRLGGASIPALSPTDSCRDRLAAYFFWNDRASLAAAVAIARRRRVAMNEISRWSSGEGFPEKFEEFRREVRRPAVDRR